MEDSLRGMVFKKFAARFSNRARPGSDRTDDSKATPETATGAEDTAVQTLAEEGPLQDVGAQDVLESVTKRFAKRVSDLRDEFVVVTKTEDVAAFLDRLQSSEEHLVRQPPMAAQKVLSTCRRSTSGLGELTTLIEKDPAITQDLLQHANSAFYASRGGNVSSLNAAVQRVGMSGVESVMMKRIVEGLMSRPGDPFDRMVGKVWPHLVRTGPVARGLARSFGVDPERAFTLALLHDAGKLVLFDHIAALRTSLRRSPDLPLPFVTAALRLLHEPLGGIAAAGWGMDDDSVVAIAVHHRTPTPETNLPLSEVIYLAERIDIQRQRGEEINLVEMWEEGALTGSLESAQAAMEQLATP